MRGPERPRAISLPGFTFDTVFHSLYTPVDSVLRRTSCTCLLPVAGTLCDECGGLPPFHPKPRQVRWNLMNYSAASKVGAAAEPLIQGAAPGDIMERGRRSPMASWSHLAQLHIQNQPRAHPCRRKELPFVLSAANRMKWGGETPSPAMLRDAVEGAGGSTLLMQREPPGESLPQPLTCS